MSRFPSIAAAVAEGAIRADAASYYEGVCARRPEYGRKLVEALRGDVRKRGVRAGARRVTFPPAPAEEAAGAAAIAAAAQADADHQAFMKSMGPLPDGGVVRRTAPVATTSATEALPFDLSRPSPAVPATAPGAVTPLASGSHLSVEEQRAVWVENAARCERLGFKVAPFRPRPDLAARSADVVPAPFTRA